MRWLIICLGLLAGAVLACDSSVGPLGSNVQVSFATRSPTAAPALAGAPAAPTAAQSDTLTDGTNTLVVNKAQLVLRRIKLERIETANCTTQPAGCEDVEVGPVLVDLPLAIGAPQRFTVSIPSGTYSEIEFEIHKVSADDPGGLQAFLNKSIHLEGTFNGNPVTFESDLDITQELALAPPLVVTDTTTSTNVTIRVRLAAWFRTSNGTLLDPASGNKGGPNEGLIKDNIKASMEAFEDDDHDGRVDP